jgi:hypothetical protein
MYHRLAIAALSLLLVSGVAHGDDVTPEED